MYLSCHLRSWQGWLCCGGNSWDLLGFWGVYTLLSERLNLPVLLWGLVLSNCSPGHSWCSDTSSSDRKVYRCHWCRNIIIQLFNWNGLLFLHVGCKQSFWDLKPLIQLLGLVGLWGCPSAERMALTLNLVGCVLGSQLLRSHLACTSSATLCSEAVKKLVFFLMIKMQRNECMCVYI